MQQEPAPARSPGPQQDPALPHTPTMPPPESVPEGHQPSPSPAEQALEEEFQFLRCQACQVEAKCPKLLPCLHTLCSGCLEAPNLKCPICQLPGPLGADSLVLDNVFFESLQRRLSVYRQIVDVQAVCNRCKESADFWCFECEKLLCAKCFEAHEWFVKHEVRPLAELRGQSVREFLDGMRRSNNIFCSNPIHCPPMLTSIYCRGCSKPLCCSCALLDNIHSELKCDISTEIQQRQEELDAMAQALQEQDRAFGEAQARMRSAVSQLDRARADTEELIHTRVRQLVSHVLAQEQALLEGVSAQYQRSYEEIAGQLGHLEAVLQRIRLGGSLVQRMKRYASDQEVLDLHGFLREALGRLRQEEPQNLQTSVRTDSFDEFKVRLQELVSCITQGTDATLPRRASPEAANPPRDSLDIDLPEEVQRALAQDSELAETQTMTLVQPVPGVHPVPVHAYSIKDSCREEVCSTVPPQKRKSCQTECPRKAIKMESEEERETRLARSSPEQPRPSTSKAVSPPHLDGPSSPKGPTVGSEGFLPNNNHAAGDAGEAEERVVVISSSEDSDAENSPTACQGHKELTTSTGPPVCHRAHAAPQLGLPTVPPSKLQSLRPSFPISLLVTRRTLPSATAVGPASCHVEHKEPPVFIVSSACPSKCTVNPGGLILPLRSRPPPLPPRGLPAILPVPRRVPAVSRGPWASAAVTGLEEQCALSAAPSGAPLSPSGSTTFLPFLSPPWLPSLTPLSAGRVEGGRVPQTLRAGISPRDADPAPWRTL
ncbi:protein PML isoform X4 [Enhydra lutris kenyoni]|uniref:Protein PML n=1 Tax=Enhydra lutris kenyoni TaxID=391180 RepID=A0A2Y9K3A1_ENHLU|nr:protein PML isoform X4 [Enhydra lutris kenyoni]